MKERANLTATPAAAAPTSTPATVETPQTSVQPGTPQNELGENGDSTGIDHSASLPLRVVEDGAVAQTIEKLESAQPEQEEVHTSESTIARCKSLTLA